MMSVSQSGMISACPLDLQACRQIISFLDFPPDCVFIRNYLAPVSQIFDNCNCFCVEYDSGRTWNDLVSKHGWQWVLEFHVSTKSCPYSTYVMSVQYKLCLHDQLRLGEKK